MPHSAGSIKPTPGEKIRRGPNWFRPFAEHAAHALGSPVAFLGACLVVVVWAAMGPSFHYSDTWQIVINTGTTIVTFLMVFLLQNTQTRDSKAIHLKLDELLRAVRTARTGLVGLEQLSDDRLNELAEEFTELGLRERGPGEDYPPIEAVKRAKALHRDPHPTEPDVRPSGDRLPDAR